MTDPTVVSLCRQYLFTCAGDTPDNALLPILADRLEELGDAPSAWLRWHWASGMRSYCHSVRAILRIYGGET